jgi:SAM-dependent methyltransferase
MRSRSSHPTARPADDDERIISANRRAYRRLRRHMARDAPEYFNPTEQARLGAALQHAISAIAGDRDGPVRAFDVGCGGGNLTRHLLEQSCVVTAADVSPDLVEVVARRYGGDGRLSTMVLDGRTLAPVASGSMDLVGTYSVLHHVPDYLALVAEMCRVLRPGGVIVIDHELSPSFWEQPSGHAELQAAVREAVLASSRWAPVHRRWQRALLPSTWITRARLMRDPRYQPGGDIHVWPDDHVEWDRVADVLRACGCEVVAAEDYLAYRGEYSDELYARFAGRLADMRLLIGRKRPAGALPAS